MGSTTCSHPLSADMSCPRAYPHTRQDARKTPHRFFPIATSPLPLAHALPRSRRPCSAPPPPAVLAQATPGQAHLLTYARPKQHWSTRVVPVQQRRMVGPHPWTCPSSPPWLHARTHSSAPRFSRRQATPLLFGSSPPCSCPWPRSLLFPIALVPMAALPASPLPGHAPPLVLFPLCSCRPQEDSGGGTG
jgi:hypothetical protein